jgi:hypothetical protein
MSCPSSATSCRSESPPATPPAANNGGRDAHGRFAKNNPGGPGNPFARRIAEFRKAIAAAATPEKVAAVVTKLEEKALEGDVAAAKLYLAYAVGRPAPAPDPDRLDVEEGRLAQQEMEVFRLMAQAVVYPLLETALDLVRSGRPAASDSFVEKTLDGIAAIDAAEQAAAQQPEAPPANGADRASVPPSESAPQAAAPPSANGAIGGPPTAEGQPTTAPPLENGANGPTERRRPQRRPPHWPRRPGGWVPPWEDVGGGPPPT